MPITVADLTPDELAVYNTLESGQQAIYLDLSEEVRRIVGRWAPANACLDAQKLDGVCSPDRRVTAQVGVRKPTDLNRLTPDQLYRDRVAPYRLKAARKGDLFLCPGGPSGMIGAMLSALTPPQDYSHMGIILEDDGFDATVVRHCTAGEDWLNSNLFATGTVFADTPLSQKLPLHGFRSDALQFVWPGTITQSVEIAFKSFKDDIYRADVYVLYDNGDFLYQPDENGQPQKVLQDKYAVVDAAHGLDDNRATGRAYRIGALTFDSVWVPAAGSTPEHWADPLIVQPCIFRETPRVRRALERIADACRQLRGHYRLFAYTKGDVGLTADGPPTLEALTEPFCRDGVYVADPVAMTRGMVCSSFVWTAAQIANETGPHILLDGRPTFPEPDSTRHDTCIQLMIQNHGRMRLASGLLDPTNPTDGLYFYPEAERADAGKALQAKIVGTVMDRLGSFWDTVAGPPLLGAFFGGASGLLISALISANPALLAIVLGTTTAYIDEEVQKVRDTAKHVSNQTGDTFREDNAAEDNESDDWLRHPHTGNAVSPDDILNSWSAPFYEDDSRVVGLYGSSRLLEVLSPAPAEGPFELSTWEISTDVTQLLVRMYYLDASGARVYVAGARVRIGCAEMITQNTPDLSTGQALGPLSTGRFYAAAVWTDPASNFEWRGPRRIVHAPGPMVDLEVYPPKQTRRSVRISGKADLLNRHATDEIPVIGTSPWVRNGVGFDSGWIPLGLEFAGIKPDDDPDFYAWLQQNYPNDLHALAQQDYRWESAMESWGIARVIFTCRISPTGAVALSIKGGTRPGTDPTDRTEPDWGEVRNLTIPPKAQNADPGFAFDFTVERTGFGYPPVRATLHVMVDNNQQGG